MITPEGIKDILEKSGYLFEQKAASIIEKFGFHVQTNKAYKDSDSGVSREIDIVAHKKVFEFEKFQAKGICYLFCECKNSSTPFVFLTRKKAALDKYYAPGEFQFFNEGFQFDKGEIIGVFEHLNLSENQYYTKSESKAVQFCKIIRNGKKAEAQHSGVVEQILFPLIKAFLDLYPNTSKSNELGRFCKLTFNIVIVNSDIYKMNTEDEMAQPEKVNYIPFLHEIKSGNTEGIFLVTFVNFNYLEQFIKKEVLEFCELIKERYNMNHDLLLPVSLSKL